MEKRAASKSFEIWRQLKDLKSKGVAHSASGWQDKGRTDIEDNIHLKEGGPRAARLGVYGHYLIR